MFQTLDDVRDYLSGEHIECLICGKKLQRLQRMHLALHGLNADGYRERFGIPWTFSLTSAPSRAKMRQTISEERLQAFAALPRPGGRTGVRRRSCPAVSNRWAVNAELGREASARRRVTVPCSGNCGKILETTALTAAQPVHCDSCASPGALKQRHYYAKKKAA
jgi:hypothetical protein